jgi:hypothetical protein
VRGNNAAIIISDSGRYVIPSNVGESVAVILGEPVWALGAEDGLDLGGDMSASALSSALRTKY